MRSVNIKRTLLVLFATAVVIVMLISVGLATFGTLASERNVMLPPNSSFVAICPLQFVDGGLMLAGTCVSGNLTVVEFRAVGNELALNFTLYDRRGGTYRKGGAEWPRFMTPLEEKPEYRELVRRLRVNASIYLVDQGMQGAGGGYTILGSPRMTAALMMEHTALVVDNKTLIVVVTFRAWRMNEEIKGIIADHVEKKVRLYREFVHQEHLRDVEEALKSYFKKK